jgi:hypothetical protein
VFAGELLDGATPATNIAVVSTPSVFVALKNMLAKWPENKRPNVTLLEHDDRFSVFSEFVYYDYRKPLDLPREYNKPWSHLKEGLAGPGYVDLHIHVALQNISKEA